MINKIQSEGKENKLRSLKKIKRREEEREGEIEREMRVFE